MNARIALACVAVLGLSACGGGRETGTTISRSEAPTQEKTLAAYLHDLSPIIDGVTVETSTLEHYRIPVDDGVELDSWIRRPSGEQTQPLVLVITPYYGGGSPDFAANLLGHSADTLARYLVPRGYAVGLLSVTGTGNSSGCFHDGGPVERQHLYDALEYLAEQPWSNGAIASIGVSYDGTTSNELFVQPPPSLKAVVPIEAITDYYRYSFVNGITREDTTFFTTYYYALVGLGPAGLNGGIGPSEPADFVSELAGEACPEQLSYQQESVNGGLTGNKTPHWDARDAIALIQATPEVERPAMFYIQGYQDANVDPGMANGFLEAVAETGVPLHIWMGQWVHAWPESSSCLAGDPCRGDFFELALLAWFDQFLKGRDTGILDAPMVQTQADDGIWRHESEWPPQSVAMQTLFAHADGSLNHEPPSGTQSYTDQTGVRPENAAGSNQMDIIGAFNALPYIPGEPIVFASEPLADTLRLTGTPHLETVVTADLARANLVVTLMAENPDGQRRYLNFAALSLNHAENIAQADDDISNKALPITLDFYPQDNIIEAGWRLVLRIGGDTAATDIQSGNSANFLNTGPSLLPVGLGAIVELDLAQTRLHLPVNKNERVEAIFWPGNPPEVD